MSFLGSYTYQLDEKGRVSLPAAFRREVGDQSFVLLHAYPESLALYPQEEWREVEERLRDLLKHQPGMRLGVLSALSNAAEVVPDAQGRILIPARMQEAIGLKGQALLVGVMTRIEIWDPARFEEAMRAGAGDFATFAPQIFR
ncbi:MAG TPA: division/cell wall cluster transcriptional repressor MraZ [Longimicrobiales bacterium]|nr:division/cell wall cluster transcriptional repressor MraZ [Longimicrobiales bacterium]